MKSMTKSKPRLSEIEGKAEDLLSQGKARQAVTYLLSYIAYFVDEPRFFGLFIRPLVQMGYQKESRLFLKLLENFDSPQAILDLAIYFSDQRLFFLSLPLLQRAYKLDPKREGVVYQLAIALSYEGFHDKALAVLEGFSKGEGSFWYHYERGWNRIFCGKIEKAIQDMFWLEEQVDPLDEESKEAFAYHRLKDTILRYQQAKRPGRNIKKWHFIQYGAALFENVFQNALPSLQEKQILSIGSMEKALVSACRWVEAYGNIQKILWVGDENAEILAFFFSLLLDLPVEPLTKVEDSHYALIVSSKAEYFPQALLKIHPGQVLFVPYLILQNPQGVCPDLTSFLVREPFIYPWVYQGMGKERVISLWEKEKEKLLKYKKEVVLPSFYERAKELWMAGGDKKYPMGRYSYSGELPFPMVKIL
ncbi:MAG: hypothetical protein D6785_03865 [Planctomycetota bacterium]|nr:MAG: hypothetical protein D6785_03865 [Planctomycetota bacterium]